MKKEFIIIILLLIVLNSQTKNIEKFNNKKYFNLQKRIEPSTNKTLPTSKLYEQREFIKPNSDLLWNPYFNSSHGNRVREHDRIFFEN
jgi:hypothetical protein